MATFFGGVIPTLRVSSSSVANALATGVAQNLADTAINVALGSVLPAEISSFLGVSPASFDNVLGSVVAPGLISAGQTAITNYIDGAILNSGALGPLGPLASALTTSAVNSLSGSLLNAVSGFNVGGSGSQSNRWFPGAGDEPDAYYNGNLFTGGPSGYDVVFSIKSAESMAASQAFTEMLSSFPTPEGLKSWESGGSNGKPGWGYSDQISAFDSTEGATAFLSDSETSGLSFSAVADFKTNWDSSKALKPGDFESGKSPFSLTKPAESWNFICAPDDISWSSEMQVEKTQIFGTNQSPVTVGSKSMRDLNLNGAMVEGFTRMKSVEGKIAKLESLMNFSIDSQNSYVKVPVFYVTANDKKYGFGLDGKDGGYFVIKSVNVKETMRDLKGDATRGTVDISFVQVPPYQVDLGRDIASKSVRGQTSFLGTASERQAKVLEAAAASGQISSDGQGGGARRTTQRSGSGVPGATSGAQNQQRANNAEGPTGSTGSALPSQALSQGNG